MTTATHAVPASRAALRDGPAAYGLVSRLNHWITAGAFLGALGLGLAMAYGGLAREQIFALMDWHKLLGVIVLLYGCGESPGGPWKASPPLRRRCPAGRSGPPRRSIWDFSRPSSRCRYRAC